ncbi:ADP-ribosylglycohydrolase [Fadolivirus algeromassiliense]|jgi:ADP-ribosylglycohydrolase|uniref:ADP-ribosylglycohydrolase n=1 Tax=Fadolivirus FV1/VV64 TaxID=3070911 RepID=A0A7D3V5Y3_9VIRU|nr:ADP-ribosylglycohydrolase [Fadolivirus algeromassiliense]QKF94512.1 ADP-ribosylglycohydrolase [Fadolivirus FV1/VV64]
MFKDRISGAIYGQFIGDALGTRYEFQKRDTVISRTNIEKHANDNFLPILGEGPFNVMKGQVTDDTELAMGLLHSILETGMYDKNAAAAKYIKWYNSNPFDIGNTTRMALDSAMTYNDIINNAAKFNKESLSNGCLMRISPLAIYGVRLTDEQLLQCCYEDTVMTNPNPITVDAVGVYCIALKTALLTRDKKMIFNNAYSAAKTDLVKNIIKLSLSKPEPTFDLTGDIIFTDVKKIGYFGIALQNAFYELFNGSSFYQSLINIVSKGGDTDTNCCIAGALLGAYYGVKGIPQEWIDAVKINNPRDYIYKEINQKMIDVNINKLFNIILYK